MFVMEYSPKLSVQNPYMQIMIYWNVFFAVCCRRSWCPAGATGQMSALSFLRCRTTWTNFRRRDSTARPHTRSTFHGQQKVSSKLGKNNTFKKVKYSLLAGIFIVIFFRFIWEQPPLIECPPQARHGKHIRTLLWPGLVIRYLNHTDETSC